MMNSKKINYIIFSQPRTGSTLICDLLHNLDIMKQPNTFYEPLRNYLLRAKKKPFQKKYIENLFKNNRINNISGFKLMPFHLCYYKKGSINTLLYDFLKIIPTNTKIIFIERKNHIRQAISFIRARKTGKWKCVSKFSHKKSNEKSTLVISDSIIDCRINKIRTEVKIIKKVLKKAKIKPLILCYEDFEYDQNKSINKILKFLEVDIGNYKIRTNLKKQSDKLTEKLVSRYKGIYSKSKVYQLLYFFIKNALNKINYILLKVRKKFKI